MNLAQSLKEMLEADYDITIVDPQDPGVGRSYVWMSRHFRQFLTWQYTLTDNAPVALWLQRVLALRSRRRFQRVIEQAQPQLIIVTHAFLSYVVARASEHLHIPLVFQLTDLEQLHMTWFSEKHATAYLAPTREIFQQALQQGIARERLYLTGRPLRRQFLEASERDETLAALKLDPGVLTLFLQGGALGSAAADQTLEVLLSAGAPVQILLAVGNNEAMATRYADVQQVRVVPFIPTIAPYMRVADLIVGKAGASFISEAFMLEKPFIATTFIAGQETPNLRFIERYNLGWVCLTPAAQQVLLLALMRDPELIAAKVSSIRAYKAWNRQANQQIPAIIARCLHEGMGEDRQASV
jgi:UDP-N-acetylglucosamine:LPS N-acetylglucosamine transferase